MKIGIDTAAQTNQSAYRGLGNYTTNLIKELETRKEITFYKGNWRSFWQDADLIHFPYFDFYFQTLPINKKRKTIVTIHDCIPLIFPQHYPSGIKGRLKFLAQKISLKNVSKVITDSENSKKDIIKYLNVPKGKISVIYLSASDTYKTIDSTTILRRIVVKYSLPEKFILYIGDVNYNKNLLKLVEAFSKLKEDIFLVLVGKSFEKAELPEIIGIKSLIKKLSLEKKIKILGYVPEQDLVGIYNLALIYCQPSLYEGFGLQILEAMACGCPVVTSSVSSMPEVAGSAAVLVDPQSSDSIVEGLKQLIEKNDFRDKMIRLGYLRAKQFSWKKTVNSIIKIYEEVLARK